MHVSRKTVLESGMNLPRAGSKHQHQGLTCRMWQPLTEFGKLSSLRGDDGRLGTTSTGAAWTQSFSLLGHISLDNPSYFLISSSHSPSHEHFERFLVHSTKPSQKRPRIVLAIMDWEPIADATGTIAGSVWPLVIVATALLSARIYCRTTEGLRLWWDDGLLVLGCAFLVSGAGCLTHALRLGHLSSDGSSSDPDLMMLLMPLAHSCHLLSMLLSKISFGMTLLRFSQNAQKIIIWVIIGTVSISFPVHAVLVWQPICDNPSPYSIPGPSCWDQSKMAYMNITTSSKAPLLFHCDPLMTDFDGKVYLL